MKTKYSRMANKPILALLIPLLWAAVLVLPAFGAQAGVVVTSLHSFQSYTNGANPQAGLVQGSDGNFYGTTTYGGTNGTGTIFKISTNGTLTSLYSFTGGNDGAAPEAGLVQGSDGNFYGTTLNGGTNGAGTVFTISTNGAYASLHSFNGLDGAGLFAGLVQGRDGNFYGTTFNGGTNGGGTVFQIRTNGTLTSLYSFTGGNDGAAPEAGLVQGNDGNFYGTTAEGGTNGAGTVFTISTNGALISLYSFTGGNDGTYPLAGLVQGSDGYFYGTTSAGGTNGVGTVFTISTNGAFASLYSFTNGNDGRSPNGLVQGRDGNFYGTTYYGGTNNVGTVFQISTNGALTSLSTFTGGNDGAYPVGVLVQGRDGYFYGTTYHGGTPVGNSGSGTVFQISTNGALIGLYSFTGSHDGADPNGLVRGSDGYLYGTTRAGGVNNNGTVFQISTNGTYASLYSFTGTDGSQPFAGLVQGRDGNFYGTTQLGGTGGQNGFGTVFAISPNGVLTNLYSFDLFHGAYPQAGLVQGGDGDFYGTTAGGGPYGGLFGIGYGTVFKISTNGVLADLYSFTGGNDGVGPSAGLVQGRDGFFYGTAGGGTNGNGTIFKISTNGVLTSLYAFTGTNDGGGPNELVQGSDGYFYGTTYAGGTNGIGTVFKINTNGALTSLYSFTGGMDGFRPQAGLVQGSDGNFYGTTREGGNTNLNSGLGYGTVFAVTTNGKLTSLYSFTGGNDGAYPLAGLVQGSDGSFYGTTDAGGRVGAGTIFRLTIQPQLTMTVSGANVILSWPTNAAGFFPQHTLYLGATAGWVSVTLMQPPVIINGQFVVTLPNAITGTQQFYRLSQ
jgi:uncharacterized repeat protein (TIGR03803 family)